MNIFEELKYDILMNTNPIHSKKTFLPTISFEFKIFYLALCSGLPAFALLLWLLWFEGYSNKIIFTCAILIGIFWISLSAFVYQKVIYPLRTLSNLLEALREGDYSMRARGARWFDAMGEVLIEINSLRDYLKQQRMGAIEAHVLLQAIMDQIEVAVFGFDDENRLCQINRYGEVLLVNNRNRLLGKTPVEIGLDFIQSDSSSRIIDASLPGKSGRWEMRKGTYREQGKPHTLILLSDLTYELRQEERLAWERLVQVLRHEINNSLAPIHSLSGSLQQIIYKDPLPLDWKEDVQQGLSVIADRSKALNRFMSTYSKATKIPKPNKTHFQIEEWIKRVTALETRLPVQIEEGEDVQLYADADQLDQLLINLLKNAVEASLETGGSVKISWNANPQNILIQVEDEGFGISNEVNLFVPFFTTKTEGSGLGLYISRQIAEAHGGSLILKNKEHQHGSVAKLTIPHHQP